MAVLEEAVSGALSRLKVLLAARYGDRLRGVFLFGSRARGDHRPDSDADVAVILAGHIEHPFAVACEIIDDAYDIFLDTGVYIEPWPFEEGSLENPDAHRDSHLAREVLRDGVAL